jgi:hypothetical protein
MVDRWLDMIYVYIVRFMSGKNVKLFVIVKQQLYAKFCVLSSCYNWICFMCYNLNLLHFKLQVLCCSKKLCVSCCHEELHVSCCFILSYKFHVVTFQAMGFVLLHFELQVLHWYISSYRFRVVCHCYILSLESFYYCCLSCTSHVWQQFQKKLESNCQVFLLISSFWSILHFFMELFMNIVCNNCFNNNCFEFCRSFKW